MIGTGETTIKISGCELRTAVAGSFEMIDSLIEMRGLESGEGHALSIYIYIFVQRFQMACPVGVPWGEACDVFISFHIPLWSVLSWCFTYCYLFLAIQCSL